MRAHGCKAKHNTLIIIHTPYVCQPRITLQLIVMATCCAHALQVGFMAHGRSETTPSTSKEHLGVRLMRNESNVSLHSDLSRATS